MTLISWPNCFLSPVHFSLLSLMLGPGHISFADSDSRDKVCLPVVLESGHVSLVLGSGIKTFFPPWLRSQIQDVLLSLALGSESGCSVIGWFLAPVVPFSLHYGYECLCTRQVIQLFQKSIHGRNEKVKFLDGDTVCNYLGVGLQFQIYFLI